MISHPPLQSPHVGSQPRLPTLVTASFAIIWSWYAAPLSWYYLEAARAPPLAYLIRLRPPETISHLLPTRLTLHLPGLGPPDTALDSKPLLNNQLPAPRFLAMKWRRLILAAAEAWRCLGGAAVDKAAAQHRGSRACRVSYPSPEARVVAVAGAAREGPFNTSGRVSGFVSSYEGALCFPRQLGNTALLPPLAKTALGPSFMSPTL